MGWKMGICLSTAGLIVTMLAAWYLMKSPFLGTPLPPVENLLAALGVLVVGLLVLRSGLSSVIHDTSSNDRVVISNKKV